jgi:hypothetical protein
MAVSCTIRVAGKFNINIYFRGVEYSTINALAGHGHEFKNKTVFMLR